MTAPVPLGHFQAIQQAMHLRELGPVWTWAVIAEVMDVYHGFKRSPNWWSDHLRGQVTPRPRGVPLNGNQPRILA